MSYTLAGITIEDGISNGVKYLYWGNPNHPLIVYLHGKGERGNNPYMIMNQGLLRKKYNHVTGTYSGWEHPEFFTQGFRVVCPQLPTTQNIWTAAYLNNFLRGILFTEDVFLSGWSLGGGGVIRYLNQADKEFSFKCGFAIAPAYDAGNAINRPIRLAHAKDDEDVPVINSDKIWATIPEAYKNISRYDRLAGGGHWIETAQWNQNVYDWFKSFLQTTTTTTTTIAPISYIPGILELSGDGVVYGNFNGNRIKIK